MSAFSMGRDINGYNSFALSPAPITEGILFAANTAASFTVPSSYQNWMAVFSVSAGDNFWVAYNATAVIPSSTSFVSAVSEQNPTARYLKAADVVSCICDTAGATLSVTLYPMTNTLG